jgi:serine/threonine-protein kinase
MSIASGTRFGPYEISSLIGRGGMGEVYRARDTRLGRDVAIKVLPAALRADPDRLRRFEQEARAAGALNHPNVVAIYDVGTERGQPFLVAELLEGESLRQRIARGALPPKRAVEIGAGIAHGLAAAHARGIVHRDLKPENLFLGRDGRPRILDFGIAKLARSDTAPASDTRTATAMAQTEAGTLVGTVGYMAPEQVRGGEIDERCDLFALGVVLHEMLSGASPFTRSSPVGTLNAILEADPPELPATVPPALQRIVRRCLEKEPGARFRSADDLAFALETFSAEATVAPVHRQAREPRVPVWVSFAAAAIVCATLAGYVGWTFGRREAPAPRPIRRFAFHPPADGRLALSGLVRLSPDSWRLIYEGIGPTGPQLYGHDPERFDAAPFAGTEGAAAPFYSPDGRWTAFVQDGTIRKMPSAGGASALVCDIGAPSGTGTRSGFLGATWGPDGTIIFARNSSGLLRVSSEGGTPVRMTTPDSAAGELDHHSPEFLPGGNAILFVVHTGLDAFRVAVRSLRSGEQRTLVEDGFAARYVPTGHLVYARGSRLLAARFDLGRLAIVGPEFPVVERVSTVPSGGWASFDVGRDGTLAYIPAPDQNGRRLVSIDRKGVVETLPLPPRHHDYPGLSPDGRRLVVQTIDGGRNDVWIYRIGESAGTRLSLEGANSRPRWAPDGRHLAISSRRGTERLLVSQDVDGAAAAEVLVRSQRDLWAGTWTPDGSTLFFVENPATGISEIKRLRMTPGAAPEPFISGPTPNADPAVSPDGRWVAYRSSDSGRAEVYLRSIAGSGVSRQISTDGGAQPVWARDGRELFYLSDRRMIAVPIRTSPALEVGKPQVLFTLPFPPASSLVAGGLLAGPPQFDVRPDGQGFILVQPADEELAPRPIYLVENWLEELKAP